MADQGVLVIGVGNELRGDDGAGVRVARLIRGLPGSDGFGVCEHQGEPIGLLDTWQGRDAVVLVDTMHSEAPAGTIRRFDASQEPLPAGMSSPASTHAVDVAQTIELGRAIDRLPSQVIVFAVEGRTFHAGSPLSPKVAAAMQELVGAVPREARELANQGASRTGAD